MLSLFQFNSFSSALQGAFIIDLSCEPFEFDRLLGQGRTKVFLESYNGEEIALKRADAADQEFLQDFKNEVKVYKALKDLQGKILSELKFTGRIGSDFNCLGFSLCGSVPDEETQFEWTEERKDELRKIFKEIHSRKVTHNDIKIENILVKDGKLFVIDFGFGKIDSFK
jgi:serine/threonine protein kinase